MRRTRGEANASATRGLFGITARTVVYRMLSNGAVAAVAVVTARQLQPSGRGILVLLLTLATFTVLVCGLGVSTSGRMYLVGEASLRLSDYLGLSAVLTALEVGLAILVGVVLLPLVHVSVSLSHMLVLGALGGSLLYTYLLNAALNAYGQNVAASAVDAFGSVAQLVAVAGLVAGGVTAVVPYAAAIVAGNLIQAVVALVMLRRAGHEIRHRYHREPWVRLVRTGAPGIAMDLSQVLTFKLDRYLIGFFLTPAAVGVYSVAASAPELLRLPTLALSQPIFHRLASGTAKVRDFDRTRLLCLAVTGVLSAATFFVAPRAVPLLFGDSYASAITPLRILLLAEFGITVYYLDASSLAAGLNRLSDAAAAAVVGLVLVVVGDLLLIPDHGIVGAAWASVLAYSCTGLSAHLLLRRRLARHPDAQVTAAS